MKLTRPSLGGKLFMCHGLLTVFTVLLFFHVAPVAPRLVLPLFISLWALLFPFGWFGVYLLETFPRCSMPELAFVLFKALVVSSMLALNSLMVGYSLAAIIKLLRRMKSPAQTHPAPGARTD